MELVVKLRFLNEYGELETVKSYYHAEKHRCERQVQGWYRLCSSCPYSLRSLDKMAWCTVFALMVGYGHQGQCLGRSRFQRRRQWRRDWH